MRLSEQEIVAGLARLEGWVRDGAEIERTFELADFAGSIAFVNRVAAAAEAADHHPDIAISWNRVTLTLSTHSEGGLTAKDLDLARELNGLERV